MLAPLAIENSTDDDQTVLHCRSRALRQTREVDRNRMLALRGRFDEFNGFGGDELFAIPHI